MEQLLSEYKPYVNAINFVIKDNEINISKREVSVVRRNMSEMGSHPSVSMKLSVLSASIEEK